MSVKIMGAIWDLDLPHELAWVLMAYADHADHDGRNCYPGTKLIAYKTGYSTRQVQRCTADLLTRGLLSVERQGGGRGHATVYRIDLSRAPMKAATDPEPPSAQPETVKGDNLSPFTANSETMTSAPETTTSETETTTSDAETTTKTGLKGDIAMSPQPLTVNQLTVTEPSGPARARAGTVFEIFPGCSHDPAATPQPRKPARAGLAAAPRWPAGMRHLGTWRLSGRQARPVNFSVLGQDAVRILGRRVVLEFVPAWKESCPTSRWIIVAIIAGIIAGRVTRRNTCNSTGTT